jgi:catechol 1,2-dioxygenase
LWKLLDRHPYRPAHIHLIVLAEGYKPITIQIFDKNSKYLEVDSVFEVKDSLIVEFAHRGDDEKAKLELEYDVHMSPADCQGELRP